MPKEINNTEEIFAGFLESDLSDEDFFSEEEEEQEAPAKPKTTPEDSREEQEEEEEQEENFFQEEEEDNEEQEEQEEELSTSNSINTLNLLKEKGYIDFELEEGEELTEEKASEFLEDSFDSITENRIEELFENVPSIVKDLNKFVLNGGDVYEYLDKISNAKAGGLTPDLDMELEVNQELVIRKSLEAQGEDEEFIKAQIEFLKDSKRLKKQSESHFQKWNTKREKEEAKILKDQEQRGLNEKNQRRELKNKVSKFLKETEEVTGFLVTKNDQRDLPNYMSDRVVKLSNGNQVTGMQKDLMRVLNSPTGSVQIAKLLRKASATGELNFEEITKDTKTKVVKEVRDNVRRNKKSIVTTGGDKKRSLASYFDN